MNDRPIRDVAALVGELRAWPATSGKGDGLSAGYVGALMIRAADALSSKVKEAGEPGAVAVKALRAYEAWEADVILNADWSGDLPTLTQHQWDWLVDIQSKRNAALLPAAALKGEAVAGDDFVARLEHAHQHSQQRILGSNIFGEAAAEITRLREALAAETKARETAERRLHEAGETRSFMALEIAENGEDAEATITTLRAELAKAGEDAERYRWLRNPTTDVALVIDKVTGEVPADECGGGGYRTYEYRAGADLDEAIDRARSEPEQEGTP
jgi:hypothetical protein